VPSKPGALPTAGAKGGIAEQDIGGKVEQNLKGRPMLWTIVVVLVILWLVGFSLHIAGALIHFLLLAAFVAVVINLLGGRHAA
jgi:hypothetical protein